jgi:thiamine-phosphate pyrophosphorylase
VTRLAQPPLYAIVDPLDTGRSPEELARAMLRGGARLLQLRLKAATSRDLLAAARALRGLTREAGALHRADIARAAAADGVHLGQDDLPPAAARAILGPRSIVGVSTHDVAQARAAAAAGADYLGVGPVFTTSTKPDALAARGTALVRAVRETVTVPLVAIGGITPDAAAGVRAAGADAVAMIGALVRAGDVEGAVRDTLARLGA